MPCQVVRLALVQLRFLPVEIWVVIQRCMQHHLRIVNDSGFLGSRECLDFAGRESGFGGDVGKASVLYFGF